MHVLAFPTISFACQVQEAFGTDSTNSSDWYVMVLNGQLGISRQSSYQLRVSCTAAPFCPAPVWSGSSNTTEACSGKGDCKASTVFLHHVCVTDITPGLFDADILASSLA